jgi:2-methylcitrate dehydratase
VGCLHAYSAASNGDYYAAEKAVDCAAQLIVRCADDEFEALFPKFQPSRVTITTNDGKQYSTRVDVPKGDPRDPMTEDEIAVKFNALGGDVIGKEQCKKLQKFIMNLDTTEKLDEFFELTTAA